MLTFWQTCLLYPYSLIAVFLAAARPLGGQLCARGSVESKRNVCTPQPVDTAPLVQFIYFDLYIYIYISLSIADAVYSDVYQALRRRGIIVRFFGSQGR